MNKTAATTLTEPQSLLDEMRETIRHHQSFQHFKTDSLWERLERSDFWERLTLSQNLKFATRHLTNPAIFCSLMTLTLSILVWKWITIFSANQTTHATPFWTNEHDGQQTEECVQSKILQKKAQWPQAQQQLWLGFKTYSHLAVYCPHLQANAVIL